MSSINFAEIRTIPIESVLAHYKVEVRKRSNTQLVADCPFPSHTSEAHKKGTLAISTEKNKGYCHSDTCRAASNKPKGFDSIDVVAMMENLTPLDAAKKLAELFRGGSRAPIPPSKPLSEGNRPLAFELKNLQSDHPAILERGISKETAMAYGVGYFPGKGSMAGRVVFPLYQQSALIGYAGRLVGEATEENPKWKMPAGLIKSFLYGLEKCEPGKLLFIVESPWAVLFLHGKGLQAASLLGSSMTEAQEACLAPFKEICVALDNDAAGKEAAEKMVARLRPNHKVHKAFLRG